MTTRLHLLILPALLLALPAAAQEKLPLSAISDYFNGIRTAETTFTQYNEDGSRSTGKLLMKRPGRMRFEYDPPNGGVVIAGSGAVLIDDTKSNQPGETYPLKRTPLSIILDRRVDLTRANMVTGHDFDGQYTVVRAQDPDEPELGQIEMKFSSDPVALRQWVITNEQGVRTAVVLNAMRLGGQLSDGLFVTQTQNRNANR